MTFLFAFLDTEVTADLHIRAAERRDRAKPASTASPRTDTINPSGTCGNPTAAGGG